MSRIRWCFTDNDAHSVETLPYILEEEGLPPGIRYVVFQHERGDQGHDHLQGYLELIKAQRISWLRTNFSSTAHYEAAKGTPKQARDYCMKEDTRIDGPWEFGEFHEKGQGRRSDLEPACQLIKEGGTMEQLAERYPMAYVKFYRGFEQLRNRLHPPRETIVYTLDTFKQEPCDLSLSCLIMGASGIGKTEFALAHFKSPLLCTHIDTLGQFNPAIHDGIVFDDMSFTHMPCESRIHLVDTEKTRQIHNRYVNAIIPAHTKKIFVHNGQPHPFYDDKLQGEQRTAVERRLNEYWFNEKLY